MLIENSGQSLLFYTILIEQELPTYICRYLVAYGLIITASSLRQTHFLVEVFMSRISRKWFVAAAAMVISLTIIGIAQTSGVSVTLTISPAPPATVAPGGTIMASGSITNNLSKTQNVTVKYEVSGPCAYTDTYSYKLALKPNETISVSRTYTAPSCSGDYIITATVLSKAATLATTSATFTVQ